MSGYQDLFLNQGEDFNTQITLDDNTGAAYNLVGFSVYSEAKTSYYTSNAALVFTSTLYNAANGIIQLSANNATSANVSARQKLVYDVILTDPTGLKTRVLEGQIYVTPGVTVPGSAFGTGT